MLMYNFQVRLAIRRAVSGKTTALGNPLPFSTDPYADEQDAVNEAMLLALGSSTHGPAMEAHMLGVHQRGMWVILAMFNQSLCSHFSRGVLRGTMGLEAPMKAISDPPMEEYLRIVSEALQHAWATGLLFPQISEELAMATHRDPSMPDYSISIYVPFSLEELTFPQADIAPPSPVHLQISAAAHLSEAVFSFTGTDFSVPSELVDVDLELPYNFSDEFFDFSQALFTLDDELDQHSSSEGFADGGYRLFLT